MQPLIKRFRVGNDYYVYDTNTNEISEVTKVIWDILEFYGDKTEEEIIKLLSRIYSGEQIQKGIESIRSAIVIKGLFGETRPSKIRQYFSPEEFKEKIEHEVSHMILGITEQCNFRCGYCIYSGKYKNYRAHTNNRMNMQTASKAVDFLCRHSAKRDKSSIGFYGGEPLLEFSLIKKVVDYARKAFEKPVVFNMTTNGSLLDDEKIKFLIDNDFSLIVSLDGPQDIHDRYRRFSNSGGGTFQKVYKNLTRFREIDENYFCQDVSIMMVLAPPWDYERLHDFISKDPVLKGIKINTSPVAGDDGSFFKQFESKDLQPKGLKKIYKSFKKDLIEKGRCSDKFLNAIFEKPLLNLQKRKIFRKLGCLHHPNGICIPGQRRVFVRPNGELLMCERTSNSLVIGNIKKGYDVARVFDILDKYTRPLNEVCLDCWAIRLCTSCFANHFSFNGYDGSGKPENCDIKRERILKELVDYCSILRENPHALDYMDNIVVS